MYYESEILYSILVKVNLQHYILGCGLVLVVT